MREQQALYWGVDEAGIPYPLKGVEDWWKFHHEHSDRISVQYNEWNTEQGEEVMVSTKFFGTDISTAHHPQRCMFETAIFLDHILQGYMRIETRTLAEECHQAAKGVAEEKWPAKQEERKEEEQ